MVVAVGIERQSFDSHVKAGVTGFPDRLDVGLKVGKKDPSCVRSFLRKEIQNYSHQIRYKSEYFFRMRKKKVTTNYKF